MDKYVEIRRCTICKKEKECTFEENPYLAEMADDHTKSWYCKYCLEQSYLQR